MKLRVYNLNNLIPKLALSKAQSFLLINFRRKGNQSFPLKKREEAKAAHVNGFSVNGREGREDHCLQSI